MSVLSVINTTKSFSHKVALSNINVSFYTGQIHALLGENGAGKSTLASIISGYRKPTSGELYLDDQQLSLSCPADAQNYGIVMVHQRPLLAPALSVWENIILGREPVFGCIPCSFCKSGFIKIPLLSSIINRSFAKRQITKLVNEWKIKLSLEKTCASLTADERLYTALMAAMYINPQFLILDEPCATLDPNERKVLYNCLERVSRKGLGIIVITHSMQEAASYADQITVLRKGISVAEIDNTSKSITKSKLMKYLFPSNSSASTDYSTKKQKNERSVKKETVFEVHNLTVRPREGAAVFNVDFTVKTGEMVLVAGQREAGVETLENVLTGMISEPYKGIISLNGKIYNHLKIRDLRKNNVGIIPFDKHFRASDPNLSVIDVLASRYTGNNPMKFAQGIISSEAVKISLFEPVSNLSGGMLQRLIIAREMAGNPKLLILAEPLHGLDAIATTHLIQVLRNVALSGTSILILASMNLLLASACDKFFILSSGLMKSQEIT